MSKVLPDGPWRIGINGTHVAREEHSGPRDFDELVVSNWLHVERMDTHHWWMRVGDRCFDILIGYDGTARMKEQA